MYIYGITTMIEKTLLIIKKLVLYFIRWGTFMHSIAITDIPTPFRGRKTDKTISVNAEECSTTNLPGEPSKDYSSDEDDYDDEREEKDYFVTQIINNAETGTCNSQHETKQNVLKVSLEYKLDSYAIKSTEKLLIYII